MREEMQSALELEVPIVVDAHWGESWLEAHTYKAGETWYRDVRLAVYAVPLVLSDAATVPMGVDFLLDEGTGLASAITLDGYTLSDELFAQVDRGFLDAAVLTEPRNIHPLLQWRPFVDEPLVLLTSKQVVADDPREILAQEPYIRFARKAWVGEKIERWLADNAIRVRETMELDTLEATSAMVRDNLGVSIVPLNASAIPDRRYFRVIELGDEALIRTLGVLCRRDTAKHKLIDLLWQQLFSICEAGQR